MKIKKAKPEDLSRIMAIYAHAREFMAANGNPNQWGPNKWPPEELVVEDVRTGRSYLCEHEGRIVGVFYYDFGRDIEPDYRIIESGSWIGSDEYGVVHRIASDGSVKGVGKYCLSWAYDQCGHLRVDTHGDNTVMQRLLAGLGFHKCGIIYVEQDDYPRYAYEKAESTFLKTN